MMATATTPARTYNQNHVPRQYTPGRRRVSMYVAWSFPAEVGRNPAELDNRFSTMTEVRRAEWPSWEGPQWSDPLQFQQGIAGGLELFFRAWVPFQSFVGEITGHVVPMFQRIDQAGFKLPLDERVLADADTLLVFGLDHAVTGQEAARRRRSRRCASFSSARAPAWSWDRTTTSACRTIRRCGTWSTCITATRWCRASSASAGTRAL